MKFVLAAAACALAFSASSPAMAKRDASGQKALAKLATQIDIPYSKHVLDNGLTVIIHEDHKAPIVAVSVWYGVGSKHEPEGKTGYAHLFEHIMFNGSQNAPQDYFAYLDKLGATDYNGTTSYDRTNYFQNVPSSALESALFLESDRMGNLLSAVTQEKLDNQIGVVQNEKRQGENQPYGLVNDAELAALFPQGHPYHHTTIGSMEDLSAASLADMHAWFQNHYGPNNAVLVLAGDVTAEQALPLARKWFGRFAAGPAVPKLNPPVPILPARKQLVMYDAVPTARLIYDWAAPGMGHADELPLSVGAHVLGGLASSRLDNILVRDEQLAVRVSAGLVTYQHASIFSVEVDVKPGADISQVQKRLDEIIADFIANEPNQDELNRVASSNAAGTISGFEAVGGFGGKAVTLAEGELYHGNPAAFKKELTGLAKVKPAQIQAALQTWLSNPVLEVRVLPGKRGQEAQGDAPPADAQANISAVSPAKLVGDIAARNRPKTYLADAATAPVAAGKAEDLSIMPSAGEPEPLDLPHVEEAVLSNGVKVYFARRDAVPIVRVVASFGGGFASDPADKPGLAAFATRVMQEGTVSRSSVQIAEESERLGASVFGDSEMENVMFGVSTVRPNLDGSLALLADIIRNPAFAANEIERVRGQQLSDIEAEMASPASLAMRIMPGLLYGGLHPYGAGFTGTGSAQTVAALGRDDFVAYHASSITPANMTIYVVGDSSLTELLPRLEKNFGDWQTSGAALARTAMPEPASSDPRIIVLNRPDSPQSLIMAGQILPYNGYDELTAVSVANKILGGGFLSRLNMDLRENKGWAYGVRSTVTRMSGPLPFIAYAPVQADKTGASIQAMIANFEAFLGSNGPNEDERKRVVNAVILEMPGKFETAGSVLGQMMADAQYNRPFDYAESTAARHQALTVADIQQALGGKLDPKKLVWIIIGDAAVIRPQLQGISIPVEYR